MNSPDAVGIVSSLAFVRQMFGNSLTIWVPRAQEADIWVWCRCVRICVCVCVYTFAVYRGSVNIHVAQALEGMMQQHKYVLMQERIWNSWIAEWSNAQHNLCCKMKIWYFLNPWCIVYCYCFFFFFLDDNLSSLSSFFNMFYSGFHFSLWGLLQVVCECWRSWGDYLLLQRDTLWRFEDVLPGVSWLEKSLPSCLLFRRQFWTKAVLVERWPVKLFLIGELILTDSFEVSFLPFFFPLNTRLD